MPIMALIEELHANDMELVNYWKEGRDFWFAQHQEKDRLYWNEREKRIDAENKLKEMNDGRNELTDEDKRNGTGKTWEEEGNSGVISETG